MDTKELATIINTAINEILKIGACPVTIKRLNDELKQALESIDPTPEEAVNKLQRNYQEFLNKVIECKGIPVVGIISSDIAGAL